MKFVADLHLHSAYARATSKNLNFDSLSQWAKWKGIGLISSADFTHPVWFKETKSKLKEVGNGFYEYLPGGKAGLSARPSSGLVEAGGGVKFILGSEISCIYTQGGQQRRIHCLLYFPDLGNVEDFNSRLGKRANLNADGRPIVGLSAKELLELALSISEKAILIPAHVWTPWFSLYGSSSGFDSLEECFGDLSKYIYAIETGLSSDPAMNWRIKDLDNLAIVSFSDAHSAPKMGRELTIFDTDFSYEGVLKALRSTSEGGADQQFVRLQTTSDKILKSDSEGLGTRSKGSLHKSDRLAAQSRVLMTLEFFPEEGKYHFTGHRNCGVRHSPEETAKLGIVCPKCAKRLTVGVMHRVEQLADKNRPEGYIAKGRPKYKSMIPLLEILSQALGSPVTSDKVKKEYHDLVENVGNEMFILLKINSKDLRKKIANEKIVEAIEKVRRGDVLIEPGFDGVFGVVNIWSASDRSASPSLGGPSFQQTGAKKEKSKVSPQPEGQINIFDKI